MDPRPVLEVRQPGSDTVHQYWHAAPGLHSKGLWAALKASPAARTQEQVQVIYSWLLQLRSESLLRRLRPETLFAMASQSLSSDWFPKFEILCRQGTESSCAFLLIAGSLSVWLNKSVPAQTAVDISFKGGAIEIPAPPTTSNSSTSNIRPLPVLRRMTLPMLIVSDSPTSGPSPSPKASPFTPSGSRVHPATRRASVVQNDIDALKVISMTPTGQRRNSEAGVSTPEMSWPSSPLNSYTRRQSVSTPKSDLNQKSPIGSPSFSPAFSPARKMSNAFNFPISIPEMPQISLPPLASTPELEETPVDPFSLIQHHSAKVGNVVDALGQCVGLVCAGTERFSLGEVGLLDNIPRTATLRSEEPVIMLRIERDFFERHIKKSLVDDLKLKVSALRSCPMFSSMSESALNSIVPFFYCELYKPRQVIYKENEVIKHVSLIAEGECVVSKSDSLLYTRLSGQFIGLECDLFDSHLREHHRQRSGYVTLEQHQTILRAQQNAGAWYSASSTAPQGVGVRSIARRRMNEFKHANPDAISGQEGDEVQSDDNPLKLSAKERMVEDIARHGFFELRHERSSGVQHKETATAASHLLVLQIAVTDFKLLSAHVMEQLSMDALNSTTERDLRVEQSSHKAPEATALLTSALSHSVSAPKLLSPSRSQKLLGSASPAARAAGIRSPASLAKSPSSHKASSPVSPLPVLTRTSSTSPSAFLHTTTPSKSPSPSVNLSPFERSPMNRTPNRSPSSLSQSALSDRQLAHSVSSPSLQARPSRQSNRTIPSDSPTPHWSSTSHLPLPAPFISPASFANDEADFDADVQLITQHTMHRTSTSSLMSHSRSTSSLGQSPVRHPTMNAVETTAQDDFEVRSAHMPHGFCDRERRSGPLRWLERVKQVFSPEFTPPVRLNL